MKSRSNNLFSFPRLKFTPSSERLVRFSSSFLLFTLGYKTTNFFPNEILYVQISSISSSSIACHRLGRLSGFSTLKLFDPGFLQMEYGTPNCLRSRHPDVFSNHSFHYFDKKKFAHVAVLRFLSETRFFCLYLCFQSAFLLSAQCQR